jgi:hypothetical protein
MNTNPMTERQFLNHIDQLNGKPKTPVSMTWENLLAAPRYYFSGLPEPITQTIFTASCLAAFGKSLDADDLEGKAHQDRSQGGDPCPQSDLPDGGGGGPTGFVPIDPPSHRPLASARLGQWMNENRMKTSTNTGEVSLPSAKESGLDLKSSNIGQMSPNGYLVRLGSGLTTGQLWEEHSKNGDKNHLETVNIMSNGKSRSVTSLLTLVPRKSTTVTSVITKPNESISNEKTNS